MFKYQTWFTLWGTFYTKRDQQFPHNLSLKSCLGALNNQGPGPGSSRFLFLWKLSKSLGLLRNWWWVLPRELIVMSDSNWNGHWWLHFTNKRSIKLKWIVKSYRVTKLGSEPGPSNSKSSFLPPCLLHSRWSLVKLWRPGLQPETKIWKISWDICTSTMTMSWALIVVSSSLLNTPFSNNLLAEPLAADSSHFLWS